MRVLVVGGGVLGTLHAWEAVARGHEVVQLEREAEARGASVRNFGLIWVSGRAPGELPAALRARELWERIGTEVPGIGFRPRGSLTLLRTEGEVAVAKETASAPDAGARGFQLLDVGAVRRLNPALRGDFLAALWCPRDGSVESRAVLPVLREAMTRTRCYHFLPGRTVLGVDTGKFAVRDDHGDRHRADLVLVCTGAALGGLVRELTGGGLPVRRVRLQMMQTEPLDEPLTTALADGDSLRYYPAFAGPARDRLGAEQPQEPEAARHHMQLLCVQRADGGLTVGDTHAYDEPFPFDLDEAPYQHLHTVAAALLGRPLPPVRRRWAGVYAQCLDPAELVARHRVADGVWVVTGPGGRGMTLAPALAEQTAELTNL